MSAGQKNYCEIALAYCEGIVAGDEPGCRLARQACQRQLDDLRRRDFKYHWDRELGNAVCEFIEQLPHVEGRWKGPTVELQPWQCFILTSLFGWVDGDGIRRFRKALVVIPRKNGKSFLAAGVGLYLLLFDGEAGAQVVSAATTRDQAKISWSVAHKQVTRLQELRDSTGVIALAHSIVTPDGSTFKPLSRDAATLEGLNVSGAVIDELHAHKTREVFDVIDNGTGARVQPLVFIISTEGDDNEGVFADQVEYLSKILDGSHEDDRYFGVHYSIDPEDDWTLESSWEKANPNYGVSVNPDDMRAQCTQARQNPAAQSQFLTKRLNVRVGAADSYFNMLAWKRLCEDTKLHPDQFIGSPCFFTIDMASKSDLTSRVMVFRKQGHYYAFTRSYLPESVMDHGKPNYDIYRKWMASDQITFTEGDRTDYEYLEQDLLRDVKKYKPASVGIDPNYNAAQFTDRMLKEGVPMEDVPHTVPNFTNPMKELASLITVGRVHHNGDPVLAWALGNVVAKIDAKNNHYPDKARYSNKIDPAVALIANLSLHLRATEGGISIYESGVSI